MSFEFNQYDNFLNDLPNPFRFENIFLAISAAVKDGKRSIIGMAPADSVAKSIADRLVAFAANQSAVATPTANRDLARAASIGGLGAVVSTTTTSAFKARSVDALAT